MVTHVKILLLYFSLPVRFSEFLHQNCYHLRLVEGADRKVQRAHQTHDVRFELDVAVVFIFGEVSDHPEVLLRFWVRAEVPVDYVLIFDVYYVLIGTILFIHLFVPAVARGSTRVGILGVFWDKKPVRIVTNLRIIT